MERLEKRMEHIDASFNVFRDALIKIQNENVQLSKNRDFLLEKHKEMLKKSVSKERLAQEINEKLVNPIRNEISENAELIKKLTSMDEQGAGVTKTVLDDLFTLVVENGKITSKDAAQRLGAHEFQVEEWARTLEDHGLIDVEKIGSITYLKKFQ